MTFDLQGSQELEEHTRVGDEETQVGNNAQPSKTIPSEVTTPAAEGQNEMKVDASLMGPPTQEVPNQELSSQPLMV